MCLEGGVRVVTPHLATVTVEEEARSLRSCSSASRPVSTPQRGSLAPPALGPGARARASPAAEEEHEAGEVASP